MDDIEANTTALGTLEEMVTDNADGIDTLEGDLSDLQTMFEELKEAALIEDFFIVNEEQFVYLEGAGTISLIDPFCVNGPGVVIF